MLPKFRRGLPDIQRVMAGGLGLKQRMRFSRASSVRFCTDVRLAAFPRDDKLYRMVKRAHDAVHELFLECHEMSTAGVERNPNR